MTPKETLEYWRKELSCEEQVKMQWADEYANASDKAEYLFLEEIRKLMDEPKLTKPSNSDKGLIT